MYIDAQAVYEYVRKRSDLNQEKIFLFGRSLGGAVALHLGMLLILIQNKKLFVILSRISWSNGNDTGFICCDC